MWDSGMIFAVWLALIWCMGVTLSRIHIRVFWWNSCGTFNHFWHYFCGENSTERQVYCIGCLHSKTLICHLLCAWTVSQLNREIASEIRRIFTYIFTAGWRSLGASLINLRNPQMHQTNIPQCTILSQKCACVHISVVKWCIVRYGFVYCGIGEMGLWWHSWRYHNMEMFSAILTLWIPFMNGQQCGAFVLPLPVELSVI